MNPLKTLYLLVTCPYQDKDCPKIEKVRKKDEGQDKDIKTLSRMVYVIAGMIAINWGLTVW